MDQMADWRDWVFKLTATVVIKAGFNFFVPGSAAVVDFGRAFYYLHQGDIGGFVSNAFSGVAELVTFGVAGSLTEAMKRSGKAAAVSAVRDVATQSSCKEASKKIGQQLSLFIASGGIDKAIGEVVREHTRTTLTSLGHQGLQGLISSGGHDICKNVGGSIYEQFLKDACKRTIETEMRTAFQFQLAADAVKTAAGKEYYELLKIEYGLAAVKGGIRYCFNRNDSGATYSEPKGFRTDIY